MSVNKEIIIDIIKEETVNNTNNEMEVIPVSLGLNGSFLDEVDTKSNFKFNSINVDDVLGNDDAKDENFLDKFLEGSISLTDYETNNLIDIATGIHSAANSVSNSDIGPYVERSSKPETFAPEVEILDTCDTALSTNSATEIESVSKLDNTSGFSQPLYLKVKQFNDTTKPTKVWQCVTCEKEFQHQYTLMRHLPTHTDVRKYECQVCGKAFRQMSTLSQHKAIHTNVRPHVCEICKKAFNRISTLISHRKTHSDLKPHKCPICGKGFHQKGNMRNHVFIHTNERPYKCNVCFKGFNQMSNLMCHKLYIHGNTKGRFTCNLCAIGFDCKTDLNKHQTKVHHILSAPEKLNFFVLPEGGKDNITVSQRLNSFLADNCMSDDQASSVKFEKVANIGDQTQMNTLENSNNCLIYQVQKGFNTRPYNITYVPEIGINAKLETVDQIHQGSSNSEDVVSLINETDISGTRIQTNTADVSLFQKLFYQSQYNLPINNIYTKVSSTNK